VRETALAGPRAARLPFRRQEFLYEIGERDSSLGRFLRQRGVLGADSTEAQPITQLNYSLMLDVHHRVSAPINPS
jgi:hypothetical protein